MRCIRLDNSLPFEAGGDVATGGAAVGDSSEELTQVGNGDGGGTTMGLDGSLCQ